jgi:hypothetical protein
VVDDDDDDDDDNNNNNNNNTYFLEQNPSWEADRFSANQEISLILWNPNVHYRIYKCPPSIPILSDDYNNINNSSVSV